jgi:hypothetical protein
MRMELEPHGLLKLATPLLRRGMRAMFQTAQLEVEKRPAPNGLRRATLGAVRLVHGGSIES